MIGNGMDWISPGGLRYRATCGANKWLPSNLMVLQFIAGASFVNLQLREVKVKCRRPNFAIKSNRINAITINNVQDAAMQNQIRSMEDEQILI